MYYYYFLLKDSAWCSLSNKKRTSKNGREIIRGNTYCSYNLSQSGYHGVSVPDAVITTLHIVTYLIFPITLLCCYYSVIPILLMEKLRQVLTNIC